MRDDKFAELVLQELRLIREEFRELRKEHGEEMSSVKKDVNSLKTKFMMVAITMGLAGGKLSAFIPFFK